MADEKPAGTNHKGGGNGSGGWEFHELGNLV